MFVLHVSRNDDNPARRPGQSYAPAALGSQVNPGQQLTRAEVLEHFTNANRWFLGGQDEELLGTLEVGRLGDVVVLSDDYFAVADEDLKKLHSVLTVLGGQVVHSGGIRCWA